jgi:hypothetical protein
MTYAAVLSSILLLYIVGSATRQMTTLLTAALIAAVIIPDVTLVVQVALLHVVFFSLTKWLKGVSI